MQTPEKDEKAENPAQAAASGLADRELAEAVKEGDWSAAVEALLRGASVETRCDGGLTALACAMRARSRLAGAFASALLELGADPRSAQAQNPCAGTWAKMVSVPASAAALSGNLDGLRLLGAFGAFKAPHSEGMGAGAGAPRIRPEHDPWALAAHAEPGDLLEMAQAMQDVDPIGWGERFGPSPEDSQGILATITVRTASHLKAAGLARWGAVVSWPPAGPARDAAQAEARALAREQDELNDRVGGEPSLRAQMALDAFFADQERGELAGAVREAQGAREASGSPARQGVFAGAGEEPKAASKGAPRL